MPVSDVVYAGKSGGYYLDCRGKLLGKDWAGLHLFYPLARGRLLTNTIPTLTKTNARIRFGVITSPRIRTPLKNTPKTGVKKEKAWSRLTGYWWMS